MYVVYQPRRRPNIVQSLVDLEQRQCSNKAKTRNMLKFAGVPKLTNRFQPLVGRSSPHCEDICGADRCSTIIVYCNAVRLGLYYSLLLSPYKIGQTIIFLPCGFFLSFFLSFFLFSSPNLSRRRLDVCHTSTHGVVLVRI